MAPRRSTLATSLSTAQTLKVICRFLIVSVLTIRVINSNENYMEITVYKDQHVDFLREFESRFVFDDREIIPWWIEILLQEVVGAFAIPIDVKIE